MKLLFDGRFWRRATGGIGRYSRELLKELLKLKTDDQFHIIVSTQDKSEFNLKDQRIITHVVDIDHYSLAEQTKLLKIIQEINADLVHFLNFNQPILFRGRRITTIHDLTVKFFPVGRSQNDPLRRLAFELVMRHAAQSAAIITPSRATKMDVIEELKVDPEKIHIIYESASAHFKPRSTAVVKSFLKKTGLNKPYILFVNQWRPHKGLPELITAFEILKRDHQLPHQLVLIGKPDYRFPNITDKVYKCSYNKDIIMPGFVSDNDLPLYYNGAAALAFPSYYEGFGLGLVEAMKSAVPIVTTEVSAMPEIAGQAALYAKPHDAVDLAGKLLAVIQNKRLAKQLTREGQLRAKSFSWHKMAKSTYELYRQVLAQ